MRRTWLMLYTGGMALAVIAAVAFAVRGYQHAHRDARWNDRARATQAAAVAVAREEQLAETRLAAAAAEYGKLTAKVNAATKTLSDEIARTKAIKRKIVTGSTIVSYVTASSKAG